MKKIIFSCLILLISFSAFSQYVALNAFGGYTFRDKINFGNAYAYINAGGFWGASLEGVNANGTGVELLYQYQKTNIPLYTYPGNAQQNEGNDGAVISYLLLNFEQYYINNPKIQPYGGLGLGAAFYKGDFAGSTSETKFAWDIKAGVKFNVSGGLGIKIGAQLIIQYPGNRYRFLCWISRIRLSL